MLSTDPIADMLTRIRNAINVNKNQIFLPHSRVKETIAKELKKAGYLSDVKIVENEPQPILEILINPAGSNATITEITRLSKPGRRVYVKVDEIPRVKNGRGVVLLSTSKGVMTGQQAAKARLGGELICKVY